MKIQHIAIIMDGNGRWAKRRGLPRSQGHQAGVNAARRVTRAAYKRKIPFLTLYALSTENLARPKRELEALSALLRQYLEAELDSLLENEIKIRLIGNRELLGKDLRRRIEEAEKITAAGKKMTLLLAVCYGARDEIARAVNRVAGRKTGARISENDLARNLDTEGTPDPDLLIRTGGERRLSNFLLWQLAYSELYFTTVLWPDFKPRHLQAAIDWFQSRERRFGRTDETVSRKKPKPGRARRVFK